MNEEILKSAKFYLMQFAEKLSDTLILTLDNQKRDKEILTKRQGDDWYGNILKDRIEDRERKIINLRGTITDIDRIVKVI